MVIAGLPAQVVWASLLLSPSVNGALSRVLTFTAPIMHRQGRQKGTRINDVCQVLGPAHSSLDKPQPPWSSPAKQKHETLKATRRRQALRTRQGPGACTPPPVGPCDSFQPEETACEKAPRQEGDRRLSRNHGKSETDAGCHRHSRHTVPPLRCPKVTQ